MVTMKMRMSIDIMMSKIFDFDTASKNRCINNPLKDRRTFHTMYNLLS